MKRYSTTALAALALLAAVASADVQVASPDARTTASAKGKVIAITDNGTQKQLLSIQAHNADVTGLAYSPDGKLLASVDKDGALKLFDVGTGRLMRSIAAGASGDLSFTQDGKTLNVTSGKVTKKFDVATGKAVQ